MQWLLPLRLGIPVLAAGDTTLVAGIVAVVRTSAVLRAGVGYGAVLRASVGAALRADVGFGAVLRTCAGAVLGTGVGFGAAVGTGMVPVWVRGGSHPTGALFLEPEKVLRPPTSGS